MTDQKSVAEISQRFGKDRLEIIEYVNFMRDRCVIHIQEITELNATLGRFGLPELPSRGYLGTDHHLTPREICDLVDPISQISPAIDRVISELTRLMNNTPDYQEEVIEEHQQILSDWINDVFEYLPDDPRHEEYGSGERGILENTAASPDIHDELSLSERRQIIKVALHSARYFKFRNLIYDLDHVLERLQSFKAIAKLVGPEAEVGILRQGFILLMTAFDAAIFDLVRVKLQKDFFNMIAALGGNEKISFQKFAEAGSMEALRDKIIEEQLKKRYVKDLLLLLKNGWNVKCVGPGQKTERLIELILRRNIYIHNRGIVDERYLDMNVNLDGLNLGDTAFIDEKYWKMADELCCVCIHNVGDWAKP